MRAVSHGEHETRLIGAPANWDQVTDGPCAALSVYDWKDPDTGHNHMISRWELEPGDIEKLQSGAPLFLSIVGQVHPVVCVYVGEPPQPADDQQARAAAVERHDGDHQLRQGGLNG
jgi:hypothetical protein